MAEGERGGESDDGMDDDFSRLEKLVGTLPAVERGPTHSR